MRTEPFPADSGRWLKALAVVAALHGGLLLVAAQWRGRDVAPPPPEPVVEMDLAPLPVADRPGAAAAKAKAPAASQQQPRLVRQETPRTEVKPEVVEPEAVKPVVVPQPVPPAVHERVDVPLPPPVAATSAASAAGGAAGVVSGASGSASGPAGSAGETGSAAASTGRHEGRGGDSAAVWRGRVLAHLERHKRYPRVARMMKREGRVHVKLTMDRQGHVVHVAVDRGAGFEAFDTEAVATVRRADPLPPPPEDVAGSTIALQLPIGFTLYGNR